ncbi:MAG: helix-turn-helix domain-containing protein [Methanobacteriota archaeon]
MQSDMSSPIQTIQIALPHEVSKRLEHVAHERNLSTQEVVASILEQWLIKSGHDDSIRIVSDVSTGKPESFDHHGMKEIIRRQDEEITWLRDEINRIVTTFPTIHLVHHEYIPGKNTHPDLSMEMLNPLSPSPSIGMPDENQNAIPSNPNVDVDELQYSPVIESSSEQNDLISTVSGDQALHNSEQVSGKTLRGLVGGVTGDKNYTVFEAAAIAGESESVILEYINDGFLPALKNNGTFLIKGNDLRQYILSK